MISKRNMLCKFVAWFICFTLILVCELIYKNAPWTCDAYDYWIRGENLKNANFNLYSINGFRGYIFPMYLGIINCIGGKTAWYIINALVYSFFFVWIIPYIGKEYSYKKSEIVKLIFVDILLVVLFLGLLAYPLSDLFAIMCCCCAIVFLRKSFDNNKIRKYLCLFLMGIFGYWAYNTRTIYLFALISLFVIYGIIDILKEKKIVSMICQCFVGFIGVICAALPQVIMNLGNLHKFYLGVPTEGLMLMQMFWGIEYQRYDTYITTNIDTIHPNAQVYFVDPSGMKILEEMHISQFNTWADFFHCFFSHPLDVILIYVRHLINFLFTCWPQMYVSNLNSSKWLLGMIGVSVVFFVVFVFINKCIIDYKSIVYYLPLLIPGILIIPGAVEYRFSLPLYIFGLAQLCSNVDYCKVREYIKENKLKVVIMYLIFIMLSFTIWSNMLANESVTPLLF